MEKFGKFLDATGVFARRLVVFIVLLFLVIGLLSSFGSSDQEPEISEGAILNLNINGFLVEELSLSEFERAFAEFSGETSTETLVSDVITAIETAKNDELVDYLLLDLDQFLGGNPTKLQIIAEAIEDFKESGKKVIAYNSLGYSTAQYYLAAHADEVHMHDYAAIFIDGYRSYRTYYKSFFDKFYIDANVFKVGTFKAFVEPYFRDSMSDEAKNNIIEWITVLWSSYLSEVSAARNIDTDTLNRYIQSLDEVTDEVNGDLSVAALELGLIDQLSNKRQFRDYLYELAPGEEDNDINIIGMNSYLNTTQIESTYKAEEEKNVALIIASGGIVDGSAGPGTIAGDDFIKLIRDAYEDESVKALVLRVDSGGGSAYASEVIADELEKFKESGRPVVASMGSVAASGGYYISAPADQIFAEEFTITGSIGVGGFIPTFERALDQIGIHEDGYSTVDITTSVAQTLTEKDKKIFQSGTDNVYQKFISKVAENRNMTLEAVDSIAQGKVWIGQKAFEIGLVDQIGTLDDAISKAAELAELEEGFGVKRINRENPFEAFLGLSMANIIFKTMTFLGIEIHNSNLKLLNMFKDVANDLTVYNDPRGIYMQCFCELK